MRSLKVGRKPGRSTRTKPSRRGQATRAPVERIVLGKRAAVRNDPFSRAWRVARRFAVPRRPMLHMTGVLLIASFIAALFAGGYISGAFKAVEREFDALVADAGFGISAIHIAGNGRTQPSAILNALGFEPGQSIFAADIRAARARLLTLDWVADAEVRRQYPNSISVSIIEKLPFALWQTPGGVFVVERSGRPIVKVQASDYPRLPLFIGDGAPAVGAELVEAIALHRAIAARVKAMQRVSERRWNLLLDDGVVVELPETGWARQLDELEHLIVDKGVLERDITEIDLRSPDNYFFQLRNGEKQQPTRGNAA
ncbi:MAG: cell division protein FtsQ/DivIB [Rhizomicrobium sp.]